MTRGLKASFLSGSALALLACGVTWAQYDPLQPTSPIREITAASERLVMTVNTSQTLTLSRQLTSANRIPRVQVNNPQLLGATPLSPTEVLVFAKKPGVTQVILWDENERTYAVDVIVYADARELTMLLESQFPNAALKVTPVGNGVLISGSIDHSQHASRIVQIAQQFYPPDKVLTNMEVGGVHQVLLHVKAMEVSRTKLRTLGFDWQLITSGGNTITSSASGLLSPAGAVSAGATFTFDIISGASDFFGVFEALREDNLAKILAEPTLVTVSGRPAFFQVGGEVPVLVPQGLGTVGVEYKRYGTQVDFVPLVLGNGKIRLEVRPRVSDIDNGRSITLDGQTIYAFKTHEADTGVELQAGQTLAIAGLVQNRIEATRSGLPWVSELPYVGGLFRRVREVNNEVELLIFVTPELVDAMDADEVPPCGPGSRTASPTDCELFLKGYIEVPNCCLPGDSGTMLSEPGEMLAPGEVLPADPSGAVPDLPTPAPSDSPSAGRARPAGPGSAVTSASSRQNRSSRQNGAATAARPATSPELPGLMGPIGYDGSE